MKLTPTRDCRARRSKFKYLKEVLNYLKLLRSVWFFGCTRTTNSLDVHDTLNDPRESYLRFYIERKAMVAIHSPNHAWRGRPSG